MSVISFPFWCLLAFQKIFQRARNFAANKTHALLYVVHSLDDPEVYFLLPIPMKNILPGAFNQFFTPNTELPSS